MSTLKEFMSTASRNLIGSGAPIGGLYTVIFLIMLYVIFKLYEHFTKCAPCTQRVYPTVKEPKSKKYKMFISMLADKVIPSGTQFIFNFPFKSDFKTIFPNEKEREQKRKDAVKFFKKTFGVPDWMLKLFMWELRVNDDVGYQAYFIQGSDMKNVHVTDGGWAVYLPEKTTLRGTYGGKDGVTMAKAGVLAYGYYIFGGFKIRYWAMCPLMTHKTYDGNYTPIDCDVLIEDAPDKRLIGLRGKAQGINKVTDIKGITNSITTRNDLTFF